MRANVTDLDGIARTGTESPLPMAPRGSLSRAGGAAFYQSSGANLSSGRDCFASELCYLGAPSALHREVPVPRIRGSWFPFECDSLGGLHLDRAKQYRFRLLLQPALLIAKIWMRCEDSEI